MILLAQILSMQYLPKETILQLEPSSSGYLYIKKEDFGYSEVKVLFRTYNGKMDVNISYTETNDYPNSDDQFNANDYKSIKSSSYSEYTEPKLFPFEFPQLTCNYLVLKYSGFSGSYIKVACSKYKDLATYIPKMKKKDHSSNSRDIFIYFKYEDFFDSNDIYVLFEYKSNAMQSTIQYQNTNVDPSFIVSFSNLTNKTPDRNYPTRSPQQFYFNFPFNSNDKYLIIYYHLNYAVPITISSSNKISYTQITNTINQLSNYNYGYLYLTFSNFETIDNIYVYFQISKGNMNNYLQFSISNSFPEYEEDFSMNKKQCDITTNESNQQKIYSSEFQKLDYLYLIIKYSDYSGESISVASSTIIRYISNDNEILLSNPSIKYGYIFLNYSDFSNTDSDEIYLYFKFIGEKIKEEISYSNSETVPIYAGQFSNMDTKRYDKKEVRDNKFYKYIYTFKNLRKNYIVIKYEDYEGDSLKIFISSINLMATLLPKKETITLNNPSKTGFIYIKLNDFDNDDMIYIYFETPGKIDSYISFLYPNDDPSYGDIYTSLQTKGYDKIDEESAPKRYSFKFSRSTFNYLLIKYSGFSGNELTVSSSTRDPFLLSVVAIAFIVIVCILIFVAIIVVIFFFRAKRKKHLYSFDNVNQTKGNTPIEFNISPIPLI